jgi:hypothetical protein
MSLAAATLAPQAEPQPPKRLDFNSTAYDQIIENCFGKDVRDRARALKQTPEYQAKIIRNLHTGDHHSDALAKRMRRDPQAKADYQVAVAHGIDAVEAPCPELVAFMDHAVNIPNYFDRELIELGANVFLTKLNPVTFFAYGWPGAALQTGVLGITAAALMTNQPKGDPLSIFDNVQRPEMYERLAVRFMETFKWFSAVAQPGAGQPYTSAFQESCRIRVIHSHIRNMLNKQLNTAAWNFDPAIGWVEDELGSPLSGADGSIVVTTMATAILMAAKDLELCVSEREMEALFQFTSYLNYMQGVPEELLFPNADDTAVYFSAYLMSLNPDCHHDWVQVAFYMVFNLHLEQAMFPNMPRAQRVLEGFLKASWNEIYDEGFRKLYHMQTQTSAAYTVLFKSTKLGFRLYNRAARYSPWMQRKLDDFGLFLWSEVFPQAEKKLKQHFAAVAQGTELG